LSLRLASFKQSIPAAVQQAELEAGMEASWAMGDDFRLPMGHVDDALDTAGLVQASLDVAIPASNLGFQMLQRMGWKGRGLGASENGEYCAIWSSHHPFCI
jgi:hypothetical protein